MKNAIMIMWNCPTCGTENQDDYANTAAPICEHCDYYSDMWDDILTTEQMETANLQLEAQSE